ncbi:MAG: hypothetical protein ACOYM9_19100 [Bradymonadia bacterium]
MRAGRYPEQSKRSSLRAEASGFIRSRTAALGLALALQPLAAAGQSAAPSMCPPPPPAPSAPPSFVGPCRVTTAAPVDREGGPGDQVRVFTYDELGRRTTESLDEGDDGHVDRVVEWTYHGSGLVASERSTLYPVGEASVLERGTTYAYLDDGRLSAWTEERTGGTPGRPDRLTLREYVGDTSLPRRDLAGTVAFEAGAWTLARADLEVLYTYDEAGQPATRVERVRLYDKDEDFVDVRDGLPDEVRTHRYQFHEGLPVKERLDLERLEDGALQPPVQFSEKLYRQCPYNACKYEETVTYIAGRGRHFTKGVRETYRSGFLVVRDELEIEWIYGPDEVHPSHRAERNSVSHQRDSTGNIVFVERWDGRYTPVYDIFDYACWANEGSGVTP